MDAGVDGGSPSCAIEPEPFPRFLAPRCASETDACLTRCRSTGADPGCVAGCIDRDPTPPVTLSTLVGPVELDCRACLDRQRIRCSVEAGCGDAYGAYQCCLSRLCPAGSAGGCADLRCRETGAAFTRCAPASCLAYDGEQARLCFP